MRADTTRPIPAGPGEVGGEAEATSLAPYLRASAAAGLLVILLGVVVLLAWALGLELLKRVRPGYVAMTPLSAVGLALGGVALLLLRPAAPAPARLWIGRAFAVAAALVGAATAAEYVFDVDLGIDRLLFPEAVAAERGVPPGRPSPSTSAALLLCGLALLFLSLRVRRRYVAAHLASLAAAFFALQPLAGYVYDVDAYYAFGPYTPMAFHTALGLLVLVLGILLARPERGLVKTVTADDAGGRVARRLLPAAIALPLLLGLLRIVGEDVGVFEAVYGLTLVIVFSMVAFVALVWWNAAELGRLDRRRAAVDAERRRALSAAEAERAYLSAVLEQMPAGVILAEAKTGRLMRGNRQVEAVWRHPFLEAETIAEYAAYKGFHPDGRPYDAHEWPLARSLETGEVVEGEEIEILRGDGTRGIIRLSSAPVRNADGEILAGVVTFYDITAERRAQEALRESEQRLRNVLDVFVGFAGVLTPDGILIDANRPALELVGFELEDVAGRPFWETYWWTHSPEVEDRIRDSVERAARGERSRFDVTSRAEADRLIDVDYQIAPLYDGRGRITHLIPSGVDITERKRTERERARLLAAEREAHAEAERRAREEVALRSAAEAVTATFTVEEVIRRIAESAVVATDADGAFVQRVDPIAEGIEIVASEGRHAPPVGERFRYEGSATERVVERGEPEAFPRAGEEPGAVPAEIEERCPDCAVVVVPLVDAGEAIGSLVIVRGPDRATFRDGEIARASTFGRLASLAFRKVHLLESSERRRAELQRVLESRSRLMRGFSHDVKNPLGAADGQLALLEEGAMDDLDPRQRAGVAHARRSIRSATRLIDSLVDLARAEVGRISLEYTIIDLRAVAREVAEEYRAGAEAKGIAVDIELPDELPAIRSDSDRIRQILGNLLSNAVKYTPPGGRIVVRVAERRGRPAPGPGRWVTVAVEDTGPGIPADKHEEVFDEFTRLEPDEGRGAGLGLAIGRRVARLLGGDVTLESEPGRGSTFTLWLPANRRPGGEVAGDVRDERSGHAPRRGRTGDDVATAGG